MRKQLSSTEAPNLFELTERIGQDLNIGQTVSFHDETKMEGFNIRLEEESILVNGLCGSYMLNFLVYRAISDKIINVDVMCNLGNRTPEDFFKEIYNLYISPVEKEYS